MTTLRFPALLRGSNRRTALREPNLGSQVKLGAQATRTPTLHTQRFHQPRLTPIPTT